MIGIVAQRAIKPEPIPFEEKDAERILYEEAINYVDRWNQAEDELASLMHLTITRPMPTVVTIGGVIDVTYVLDTPHGYEWKGVYVDANLRSIETIPSLPIFDKGGMGGFLGERQKDFMKLSALQGSILENRTFEDDFQVESISTAKLLSIVNSRQQTANSSQLLTIDKTNISSILPTLPFDDNIKEDIINAVNQNLTVKIPDQDLTYQDWTGIGYIKENTDTRESGWLLSGMIAGGMTAVSPDKWSNQFLAYSLHNPNKDTVKTIIITSPKNGTTITTSPITVEGIVLDSKAKVLVNGVEAIIDGNTFTATGIILSLRTNTITAIATNKGGKKTSDAIVVTYKIPLKVSITFPYDGANLSVTPIDVEGIVSDSSASIEVNGIKAVVSIDGRFIASGLSLSEGSNQITAQAMNIDGKIGTHTIDVDYKISQVTPISISITTPEANATISRPTIMVKGTVTSNAEEVSIKVNGILAEKYGSQFVANNVPLVEGDNAIIVNALGSNGAIGRAEIIVKAVTTRPYITLNTNITSGIPPLTTYFSVSTEIPNPVTNYQIDFDGDGVVDFTGASFKDISHTYTTEGIFYPTVTVTDDQENSYTDTIAVTLLNKAEIDALLKGKWEGMKKALNQGNINSALNSFLKSSREEYKGIFELLAPQLPFLVSEMREITMIEVLRNVAEYYIKRSQRGTDISYFIYFVKDADGIWKIDRF